jgi:hypothetical protein
MALADDDATTATGNAMCDVDDDECSPDAEALRKDWRPWGPDKKWRKGTMIFMLSLANQLEAYDCGPNNGAFEHRAGFFRATWDELDDAVECLIGKIEDSDGNVLPGMQNPTTQPFGVWLDSYFDRADVTMMQLSTSDESGARKCESSDRTTAQSSTDAAVLVAALSKREVLGAPGKVTAAAFQEAWKEWGPKLAKFGNQRALFKHFMPKFNDKLPFMAC